MSIIGNRNTAIVTHPTNLLLMDIVESSALAELNALNVLKIVSALTALAPASNAIKLRPASQSSQALLSPRLSHHIAVQDPFSLLLHGLFVVHQVYRRWNAASLDLRVPHLGLDRHASVRVVSREGLVEGKSPTKIFTRLQPIL